MCVPKKYYTIFHVFESYTKDYTTCIPLQLVGFFSFSFDIKFMRCILVDANSSGSFIHSHCYIVF